MAKKCQTDIIPDTGNLTGHTVDKIHATADGWQKTSYPVKKEYLYSLNRINSNKMKFFSTAVLCVTVGCLSIFQSQAQSNSKSTFNNLLNKVVESRTGTFDISGRWTYQGAACSFESDNILKKTGGAVAANQLEKQFDEYLTKMGISEGAGEFTFNADSTYSAILGKAKLSGDYTLDESNKTITLSYLKGIAKIDASVVKSGNNLQLLFDADSILRLLKIISVTTNNNMLKAISSITDQYDGMLLGFDLQKQE
ncbi:DUF4923 family protein [Proteiniphilum sp. UBA5384]|uniref:DUF4923 family protein n=1 Tax=Proteiniphilum sp. UBA5384 TaxID=1947279 RepID=UPI0025F9255C|nr:DUF4923 family protein [Proteiniphilum sp. UBA5384]